MDTQLFDIDVKLPIIRATDDSSRSSSYDSIPIVNNNNPTNNIHNHHNHSNNNDCNNNNNTNQRQLLDLPKPSYRIAQNYHYKRRTHTAKRFKSKELTQDSYFHYQEPTPEQLLDRVEYDMDDEDTEWLKIFNKDHGAKFGHQVGENEFEKIMDRLEKESYFESKKSGKEVLPDIDEDAVCSICNDGKCENANVILFCDMCDLAVHQECYGVPYIPEGQWLCRRCLQSPSRNVDCVLCPNKGGAFKQTDDNRWAHVICALWVPEVCFANTVFLEPIDSIDRIPAARWRLCCYICKQKKIGACIQCHKPNCYVPFHVTCAQQAGLYMKIKTCRYDTPEGEFKDVKKEAFCDAHGPSNGSHRAGMYSGDETDEEDLNTQAYKKWKKENRDKMKKTRKILAEKRESAFNPIAEPTINDEKLLEISKLLTLKGKKNLPESFIALRETFIRHIQGYWLLKRAKRNGVPLLRRLQVSYTNNSHVIGIGDLPKSSSQSIEDLDKEKYTRLRYDLEKARLLVGEVKKRELLKKRLFKYSMEIVENRYKIIDNEHPVLE